MSSILKTRGKRMDTKKGGSKQAKKWPEIKGIEKKGCRNMDCRIKTSRSSIHCLCI